MLHFESCNEAAILHRPIAILTEYSFHPVSNKRRISFLGEGVRQSRIHRELVQRTKSILHEWYIKITDPIGTKLIPYGIVEIT
ncbi:hypothetical protein D3C85_1434740 [compost metagenome]